MHSKLVEFFIKNKGLGAFKIDAKTSSDEASIYLYDFITSDDFWGGITAKTFVKELNSLSHPVIHLRVDSGGGDVFSARAIAQAIKEHPSKIIAHVDGMAASAATSIVLAADESVISEGGGFMIHNSWALVAGNANELTEYAALLARVDNTIASEYVAKTGKTAEEIKNLMDKETYFFGAEAVQSGFIDAIAEAAPKNQINWDLSAYQHAPAQNKQKSPENSPKPDEIEPKPAEIDEKPPETAPIAAQNRPKRRPMLAA